MILLWFSAYFSAVVVGSSSAAPAAPSKPFRDVHQVAAGRPLRPPTGPILYRYGGGKAKPADKLR
jgi:hypothetical protein